MHQSFGSAYSPFQLNGIELRNRFIKTATHEGMTPHGLPCDQLIEFHRRIIQGGVAMTTVAYLSVNPDGRSFDGQMYYREEIKPKLRALTNAIHAEGGHASIQLTHCGFFTKNKKVTGKRPLAPSSRINEYGLVNGVGFARAMTESEIAQTANDFAEAAQGMKECGFDAVEIHMGHGYLLSQFISPWANKRKDQFGGCLNNRMFLPLMVYEMIRDRVGKGFPILCKINLCDGIKNGLQLEEAVEVARQLEQAGADALVLSGGLTSRTAFYLMRGKVPLKQMIKVEKNKLQQLAMKVFGKLLVKPYPFTENFFMDQAQEIRKAVNMPLVLLGGIVSKSGVTQAMENGFDLMAMGRALIHDPDFVLKLKNGDVERSACNHCNQCVVEMDKGGVKCVL